MKVSRMFAAGALAAILAPTAFPDFILQPLVTAPNGTTIVEPGATQLTFQVFNPNAVPLILDYAFASINTSGDRTDFLNFAGVNGANGLASAALIIGPRSTGVYVYGFVTDTTADPGPPKDGKNVVSFAIEMSQDLGGGIAPVFNKNGAFFGLLRANGAPSGGALNAAVAANLLGPTPRFPCQVANGCNPNAPNILNNELLYEKGVIGVDRNGISPSTVDVFVSDVPEPTSWLLSLTAVGLVAGIAWSRVRLKERVPGTLLRTGAVASLRRQHSTRLVDSNDDGTEPGRMKSVQESLKKTRCNRASSRFRSSCLVPEPGMSKARIRCCE